MMRDINNSHSCDSGGQVSGDLARGWRYTKPSIECPIDSSCCARACQHHASVFILYFLCVIQFYFIRFYFYLFFYLIRFYFIRFYYIRFYFNRFYFIRFSCIRFFLSVPCVTLFSVICFLYVILFSFLIFFRLVFVFVFCALVGLCSSDIFLSSGPRTTGLTTISYITGYG